MQWQLDKWLHNLGTLMDTCRDRTLASRAETISAGALATQLGWTAAFLDEEVDEVTAIASAMCKHLGFDESNLDSTQVGGTTRAGDQVC